MKPIDYAKAAGLAVLILALNLLLTTAAIFVYATLFEPGQPQAFYNAMAPKIAHWTAPVGGALLFLLAGWLFAKRRPARNGLAFAAAIWVAYLIVDAGSAIPMGGLPQLLTLHFAGSMLAALAGGLIGAALARRGKAAPAAAA